MAGAAENTPGSPLQRGDPLVPAGGSARGQAGAGLPRAVAVPGLVLSLPPVLRVPVVLRWRVGPEWELEGIIEDAEGKLAVALRQGEQVLIHILGGRNAENRRSRGGKPPSALVPSTAMSLSGAGTSAALAGTGGLGLAQRHLSEGQTD